MSKIIVVTFIDKDPTSPTYQKKIVSHGINTDTCDEVIFPPELFDEFPCHYDSELDEYVLNN